MKTKTGKMNTYLKYGLILLAFTAFGGVLGAVSVFLDINKIGSGMEGILRWIQSMMLPILLVLAIISVLIGEAVLGRNRAFGKALESAEDAESDRIEYEMERLNAISTIANNSLNITAILVLATGYSLDYIVESARGSSFLISALVFVLMSVYNGFWSVRFIKDIQKIYPDKCGDPASGKFQEQWLNSCDEAEKEMIYQSAYKAYSITMKAVHVLIVAAMLCHLMWNTGIMAVLMLGIIWLVMTVVYCKSCVQKKESKLNT